MDLSWVVKNALRGPRDPAIQHPLLEEFAQLKAAAERRGEFVVPAKVTRANSRGGLSFRGGR